MKHLTRIFIFSIFLTGSCIIANGRTSEVNKEGHQIADYNSFKKLFKNPPSEYRSAPLWDWNDKITEDEIDFQMQKFKEGGIGGVFIHPRPGLITEYLSEDWNRLYHHTIKKAKSLGMKVWIYDENSYPSGFAGGHVPAQMPESYNHGTGLSCEYQEILKPDTVEYEHIIKQNGSGFVDITGDYKMELGAKGKYYLFKKTYGAKSYWYGNFPYVDLLYKGVTQKFMDITMKGYEKYNKADFGKTLMGIFTDEPNLEAAMGKNSVFRWTPDLYREFKNKWGYELQINLPSLVDEVGNWKKVRHDYYETILEMFLDRWAKPWNAYCEKNGLAWTGHYWEHGWPRPTEGMDESAFYIYHQQPGVDMLGNQMVAGTGGVTSQFGNTRAVRELLSAANQGGHSRRLSETYGGAGWEINFKNFKRLLDWEVVLGVNFVNQHLSYFTMKGVRKFDYPPSFSYHEPWWSDYKTIGDYIGRICLATTAGHQINRTLVLQPNTTAWMYFSRKVKNSMVDTIQRDFKMFVYKLERNHFEYDLGSEEVLRTLGSVKGSNLLIGQCSYNLIVIPKTMENLDNSTFELMKVYLENGGKILSFRHDIPFIDGAVSENIKKLMNKYPKQWQFAINPNEEQVRQILTANEFSISEDSQKSGELYHQRRIMKDGQLVFFVNSDTICNASATIQTKGKTVVKMDLITGKSNRIAANERDGKISFQIDLFPAGSELYYISNATLSEPEESKLFTSKKIIEQKSDVEISAEGENVLVLDYLDLKSKDLDMKESHFMKAMSKLYEKNSFPMGNPWQHKIQYKSDYLALDTFKKGSGFEVTYHFNVSRDIDLNALYKLDAVIERPELWNVYFNGELLKKSAEWWIDRQFYRFPIGNKIKKGENVILLKADKMSVHAEIMPVYVVGEFLVKPLKQGFEISTGKLSNWGSWQDQGYPFYSQKVSYKQTFNLEGNHSDYFLKLNKWNGTLAEVKVNGKKAGIIAWEPYQLNIGSFLKEGRNDVTVTVVGSLKNTFGYFYTKNNSSINGPWAWNSAPDNIPSINQYFLMDYGLFEPFSLIEIK
jgi:hypothetical protein